MSVSKEQLGKAWEEAIIEEVELNAGIPFMAKSMLHFRDLFCQFLEEGNTLQRAAKDEVKAMGHTGFIFGMSLAMRIVRNSGETFFNGAKPDELMLEGIISMIRIVQVQIGSGRMAIPEFTEEEIEEVRRIS